MEKIIIREKYLKQIRPFYDSKYIKAITGIRRCGKSELLKQIINEINGKYVDSNHILFYDLEGKSGEGITTRKKLEDRLDKDIKDKNKYFIFIDEVQHIKKFEEAIASVRVSYNCSLFITGSNSRLLHGKLQDKLTGRAKEFEIFPFTYKETIEYKRVNKIKIKDDDFYDYLRFGGMPQRYEEVDEEGIRKYLTDLYDSIIEKDVYGQHLKINKSEFEPIAKYIISTTGRIFSALSIAKYFKDKLPKDEQKIFSQTVCNYVDYLKECYFVSECKPFYLKGKERLNGNKKYYSVDVGIRSSLGNTLELDDTFSLENIICNELLYRGYEVNYGKLRKGEIDFIAIKNNKKCLIQVAYHINNENTFKREFGAFDNVNDNSPKYVLSLDTKNLSNNGITHINIIDFLLGKNDISLS